MSVVISSSLVASLAAAGTADNPVIGYRNVVTTSVTATSSDPNFPASNLANPATHLRWQAATTAIQYVTIPTTGLGLIDYVGIAKHNLGSAGLAVSIEGDSGSGFTTLVAPTTLTDDGPAIFRFPALTTFNSVRIKIEASSGTAFARIAVVYCGLSLTLERRIYVGHTPMPHGRTFKATNAQSEAGNFLGRIVLSEFVKSKIPLQLLSPAWYRANLDPFLEAAIEIPFFFAWRPQTYPDEVGYGWLTNQPAEVPTAPSNLIALDLEVAGIA